MLAALAPSLSARASSTTRSRLSRRAQASAGTVPLRGRQPGQPLPLRVYRASPRTLLRVTVTHLSLRSVLGPSAPRALRDRDTAERRARSADEGTPGPRLPPSEGHRCCGQEHRPLQSQEYAERRLGSPGDGARDHIDQQGAARSQGPAPPRRPARPSDRSALHLRESPGLAESTTFSPRFHLTSGLEDTIAWSREQASSR